MVRRTEPVRTCVGCRTRAGKTELLRVVVDGDVLVPDVRARLPGRGAFVHPTPGCLDLAERRRAFPRALRLPGPLDAGAVRRHVEPGDVHHRHSGTEAPPSTSTSTISRA